jgi:site-specific recombinase XerD
MTSIVPYSQIAHTDDARATYEAAKRLALASVAASSARTYAHALASWELWCKAHEVHPLDLRPSHVLAYLTTRAVTVRTRQRELNTLRTLAKILALDYTRPEFRALYDALKIVRAPGQDAAGVERERRALAAQEVWQSLAVWRGPTLAHRRNRALLAVAFYTGLRRAELVALRWSDVDLDAGVIQVRHGKGDKRREVAIVGDDPVSALSAWRSAQTAAAQRPREFVFCALRRGDHLAADKPMTVQAVNQIIEATSGASGVTFSPHDARRTLATDLLVKGASVADVQAQLGHAHASTTIQGYGMGADARRRRARFDTSY